MGIQKTPVDLTEGKLYLLNFKVLSTGCVSFLDELAVQDGGERVLFVL